MWLVSLRFSGVSIEFEALRIGDYRRMIRPGKSNLRQRRSCSALGKDGAKKPCQTNNWVRWH